MVTKEIVINDEEYLTQELRAFVNIKGRIRITVTDTEVGDDVQYTGWITLSKNDAIDFAKELVEMTKEME